MRKAIICIFWRQRVHTSGSAWQTVAISRPQLGEAPLGCRHQLDEERRLHNPQKSIERIRERSGVEFQIRDIRPTVTTGVAEDLGITSFIIGKAMDHKLPGEAEMGEVDNRYDYPGDPDKPHAARAVRRMCRTAVLSEGAGRWHESCSFLTRCLGRTGRPGSQVGRRSGFEADLEVKSGEGRVLKSRLECRNEEA